METSAEPKKKPPYPREGINQLIKELIQRHIPPELRKQWNGPLQRYISSLYNDALIRYDNEEVNLGTLKTVASLGIESCLHNQDAIAALDEKISVVQEQTKRIKAERHEDRLAEMWRERNRREANGGKRKKKEEKGGAERGTPEAN